MCFAEELVLQITARDVMQHRETNNGRKPAIVVRHVRCVTASHVDVCSCKTALKRARQGRINLQSINLFGAMTQPICSYPQPRPYLDAVAKYPTGEVQRPPKMPEP